ncbi:MAG: hypothetical protein ACR2GD_03630 [Pyrinomonadaceae bacterium]
MRKKFLKSERLISLFITFGLIFFVSATSVKAQQIVDKTVAAVSDSVNTELITYSDLLWQLALQPDVPIRPPGSPDLNRALQTLINQRLIALEAQRLPSLAPSDAEVKAEIKRVLDRFPSTAEFERRLRVVGFDSVTDDNFERIMRQRVAIDKYLDFRFRSFVIITPDEEAKYYRETFVPDFRKKNPGVLVPSFDESRARINKILTEAKISDDIEKYLEDARRRAEITILFEV